ncbi:S66 peptidase family protein [Gracilimonas halophila]|uniref:LD-carboxypeptidase n=1 Tax=Gracilimonas halophila TaxID=1834464 RepID=A0ABW5JIB4_9BACT
MNFTRKDFLRTTALASLAGMTISGTACNTNLPVKGKIKPKALKEGDTLGLIAPASPIYEESVFDEMLINLTDLGFELKLGKHVRNRNGYLAGTDQERLEDLMNMFKDPKVDGIMCIRGGWGCNRILPYIDYDVIRSNPKVFCGFSDITSLHMAFYERSDLYTFHGPVGKSVWNSFTTDSFKSIIWNGEEVEYMIPDNSKDQFTITPGTAEGRLIGGNLSVLVSMIGSEYLPSFEGAILFLEDIGESVYRIDRMLTQLKLAGVLDQLSGFVFGKCTECSAGNNSLTLEQVFEDHISPLNIPAFYGAMISHEDDNVTIPFGISGTIDAATQIIRINDSAVV